MPFHNDMFRFQPGGWCRRILWDYQWDRRCGCCTLCRPEDGGAPSSATSTFGAVWGTEIDGAGADTGISVEPAEERAPSSAAVAAVGAGAAGGGAATSSSMPATSSATRSRSSAALNPPPPSNARTITRSFPPDMTVRKRARSPPSAVSPRENSRTFVNRISTGCASG